MWWKELLEGVIPIAAMILVSVLAVLGKAAIKWLEKKLDFDISESNEAKILDIIEDAVAYAEEQALKALKSGGEKPSGESKMATAVKYVMDRVKELGLPELARESIVARLEATLGLKR